MHVFLDKSIDRIDIFFPKMTNILIYANRIDLKVAESVLPNQCQLLTNQLAVQVQELPVSAAG